MVAGYDDTILPNEQNGFELQLEKALLQQSNQFRSTKMGVSPLETNCHMAIGFSDSRDVELLMGASIPMNSSQTGDYCTTLSFNKTLTHAIDRYIEPINHGKLKRVIFCVFFALLFICCSLLFLFYFFFFDSMSRTFI